MLYWLIVHWKAGTWPPYGGHTIVKIELNPEQLIQIDLAARRPKCIRFVWTTSKDLAIHYAEPSSRSLPFSARMNKSSSCICTQKPAHRGILLMCAPRIPACYSGGSLRGSGFRSIDSGHRILNGAALEFFCLSL
jgi:hypothetical protein